MNDIDEVIKGPIVLKTKTCNHDIGNKSNYSEEIKQDEFCVKEEVPPRCTWRGSGPQHGRRGHRRRRRGATT